MQEDFVGAKKGMPGARAPSAKKNTKSEKAAAAKTGAKAPVGNNIYSMSTGWSPARARQLRPSRARFTKLVTAYAFDECKCGEKLILSSAVDSTCGLCVCASSFKSKRRPKK